MHLRMGSLFLALACSVVAASALIQEVTPGSVEQKVTPGSQKVTPGSFEQKVTPGSQKVTPASVEQKMTPGSQEVTPGSFEQKVTPGSQKVTPGSFEQKVTPGSQEVTPASVEQKVTPGSVEQNVTPGSQKVTPGSIEQKINVDEYLRTYGYMMNGVNELSEDYAERRTDAIKSFQKFAGLEVTGVVDADTREIMLKPRCGMKDIEIDRPANARWNVSEITYSLLSYTKDISESDTRSAIASALTLWEGPSKLTFKKVDSGNIIMKIRFESKKHPPCPYAFDGAGGVVAHAFFPSGHPAAGDMHFDDGETFKYKTGKGLEVASVVLHESGHALGLGHDSTKGSIMAPYYSGQTTLGPNDIKRMKALYA